MNKNCYIDKKYEIIKFVPEKYPKEIIITEQLFKKLFYICRTIKTARCKNDHR